MGAFGTASSLGGKVAVSVCVSMLLGGLGSVRATSVQLDLRPCIIVPTEIVSGYTSVAKRNVVAVGQLL